MSEILSEITYPHKKDTLEVAYSKMILQDGKTKLVFRLANRNANIVVAYRVDITYYNEQNTKRVKTVEKKHIELLPESETEEFCIELGENASHGEICVSVVLYDDLYADMAQHTAPFASFEEASKTVNAYLSGEETYKTDAAEKTELYNKETMHDIPSKKQNNAKENAPVNYMIASVVFCAVLIIATIIGLFA